MDVEKALLLLIVILVLLLAVCIVVAWPKSVSKSGGYESDTAKIYDALLEYVREVGTSKYVEEYLVSNLDLKPKPVLAGKEKFPKLYQIVDDIVFLHNTKKLPDFLRLTGLRYEHFLQPSMRCIFQNNYHNQIDAEMEEVLRKMFGKHVINLKLTKQLDNLILNIIPGHRLYKLKSRYVNKSLSVIKRAGATALEPDTLGLLPIVDLYSNWINGTSDKAEIIRVLTNIDTTRLRDFEVDLLKKLLKRVEFTDYETILRRQLKWDRDVLEREKFINEKIRLDMERKKLDAESKRLRDNVEEMRKIELRSKELDESMKKLASEKAAAEKAVAEKVAAEKATVEKVEKAEKADTSFGGPKFHPGQTVYNKETGEKGEIKRLRDDKDMQNRYKAGESYKYSTTWDTYVSEDDISTTPGDMHSWIKEAREKDLEKKEAVLKDVKDEKVEDEDVDVKYEKVEDEDVDVKDEKVEDEDVDVKDEKVEDEDVDVKDEEEESPPIPLPKPEYDDEKNGSRERLWW